MSLRLVSIYQTRQGVEKKKFVFHHISEPEKKEN